MHLIYIDDSNDPPFYTFSALAIHEDEWKNVFKKVKNLRRALKASDGINVHAEFHATDFLAGRGRLGPKIITQHRRAQIYIGCLAMLATLKGVSVFNVFMKNQEWAFERMLNRINRTMLTWESKAILFCDEGEEGKYTRLARKLGAFNPIPSKYGVWPDGSPQKSIPTNRILEDPIFKDSQKSYFIQLADFCAFSLLRREIPTPATRKHGTHKAFEQLKPICVLAANPKDPFGIVR